MHLRPPEATRTSSLCLYPPLFRVVGSVFGPRGGAIVTSARDAVGLGPWQLYHAAPPAAAELDRLVELGREVAGLSAPVLYRLDRLPDIDWVAESQRSLPPIAAGRFRIRGSHITEPAPPGPFEIGRAHV